MKKGMLDTSRELLICTAKQGLQLVKPSITSTELIMPCSVANFLDMPIHTYFLDKNSVIQNINESTVENCKFPSIKRSIGRTVDIAADKESALFCTQHDRSVMASSSMRIAEENFQRAADGLIFTALTFKYPWFQGQQVIGVIGFSIVMGDQSNYRLSEALQMIEKFGLLGGATSKILGSRMVNNYYLSKRETQCASLLARGKTAKTIAYQLGLSRRTVEHYIDNMKYKLNVYSKQELIEKLLTNNLIQKNDHY